MCVSGSTINEVKQKGETQSLYDTTGRNQQGFQDKEPSRKTVRTDDV
jgi:hypothetical protein